jgi:electron transfer flavoprotein alpha subunit
MRLVVCVKQVPDVAEVHADPVTHTLRREGVRSILNPFDRCAVEEALRLRGLARGTLTALSMGPPQAEAALREVLSMGADRAVLLTDRSFAGSDTWATSVALSAAIARLGDVDLVFFGRQAADGDTAQVGPGVAGRLDWPQATYVCRVGRPGARGLLVERSLEAGRETLRIRLPAVLTIGAAIHPPRLPTLAGVLRAARAPVVRWSAADLGLDPARVGLKGSPTRVVRMQPPERGRGGLRLGGPPERAVRELLERIADCLPSPGAGATAGFPETGRAGPPPERGPEARGPVRRPAAGRSSFPEMSDTVRGWRDVWVVCEPMQGRVPHSVTLELLGAGQPLADALGQRLAAVLPGHRVGEQADALAAGGADLVYLAESASLRHYQDERHAALLAAMARAHRPSIVLFGATAIGRSLAPRVAVLLGAGLTADCTGLDIDPSTGCLRQTRPAFGGNVLATILCPEARPQMATVRPRAMRPLAADPARRAEVVVCDPAAAAAVGRSARVRFRPAAAAGNRLDEAVAIVAGGRGMGGPAGFALLRELAAVVGGAAVGASRAAVEAGWAPASQQVGQTGHTVRPRLYLACGISGQIQHLAGMDAAETIVAINRDAEAPIFRLAKVGIVGDVGAVIPEMIRQLRGRAGCRA